MTRLACRAEGPIRRDIGRRARARALASTCPAGSVGVASRRTAGTQSVPDAFLPSQPASQQPASKSACPLPQPGPPRVPPHLRLGLCGGVNVQAQCLAVLLEGGADALLPRSCLLLAFQRLPGPQIAPACGAGARWDRVGRAVGRLAKPGAGRAVARRSQAQAAPSAAAGC